MHFYDHPTSPTQIRIQKMALALCWAAVAYCRFAGIDMHATGGPASAPKPAEVAAMFRNNRSG